MATVSGSCTLHTRSRITPTVINSSCGLRSTTRIGTSVLTLAASCVVKTTSRFTPVGAQKIGGSVSLVTRTKLTPEAAVTVFVPPLWASDEPNFAYSPHSPWSSNPTAS